VAVKVSATSKVILIFGTSVDLGVYGTANATVNVKVDAPSVLEVPLEAKDDVKSE
jgi:hypothetical protein